MSARLAALALATVAAASAPAAAQVSAGEAGRGRCAAEQGARVQVTTDEDSAWVTTSRLAIDTTWRFDVAERRWSRRSFGASIAAGLGGTGGAASGGSRDHWWLCAGAAVGMQDPTLLVRGARGLVHLRADLTALAGAGGATRAAAADTGTSRR
jgi:hypothetical protein